MPSARYAEPDERVPEERVVPPAPSPVDAHTHSRRSDGVLQPAELARAAAAAGVRVLAISDHDTLAGYRELTRTGALPVGLTLIPAVEINTIAAGIPDLWEGELHVLGYGVDADDEAFEAILARQRGRRADRFAVTVARLRDLGLAIDEQVAGLDPRAEDALGRPTLARCLVAAGHATSVEDAFQRILGRGQPGYVPRAGLDPAGAIGAIRAAGGLPVLAHFADAPLRLPLLRDLRDLGLGGLETYYRAFARPTVEAVAGVAAALGLVPTGGSDYHGDTGSYAEIHAGLWVPPAVGDTLLETASRTSRP